MAHTAMFDAWAAYDEKALSTQLGGSLRRPQSERTVDNKQKAISFAAYRVLVDLLPTQAAVFDSVMNILGYNASDPALDGSPAGIGNICAQALLNYRHHD
jgi:hypothetical protein